MRVILLTLILFVLSNFAFAKEHSQIEEEGLLQLNQNPLAPGQAPVNDPRLAPTKDTGGIILPRESNDLLLETAVLFGDKEKKSLISKDFFLGFVAGGALVAFVSFFMLKYARRV